MYGFFCITAADLEIALRGDPRPVRAAEAQPHAVGVRAGGEHEVVFQLAAVAVVDHVDARPHGAIPHPLEMLDAGAPLLAPAAGEIVAAGGQRAGASHLRMRVRAHQRDVEVARARHREHRLAVFQRQRVFARARRKTDARVPLALVRLETKRQIVEHLPGLGRRGWGGGCQGLRSHRAHSPGEETAYKMHKSYKPLTKRGVSILQYISIAVPL